VTSIASDVSAIDDGIYRNHSLLTFWAIWRLRARLPIPQLNKAVAIFSINHEWRVISAMSVKSNAIPMLAVSFPIVA
jgi:hypothetical protein